MIRINCPYCGEREHSEFTYGEDATRATPENDAPLEQWNKFVYERLIQPVSTLNIGIMRLVAGLG